MMWQAKERNPVLCVCLVACRWGPGIGFGGSFSVARAKVLTGMVIAFWAPPVKLYLEGHRPVRCSWHWGGP